jgi:hypothetical protein
MIGTIDYQASQQNILGGIVFAAGTGVGDGDTTTTRDRRRVLQDVTPLRAVPLAAAGTRRPPTSSDVLARSVVTSETAHRRVDEADSPRRRV